jgi:hypothetical protein
MSPSLFVIAYYISNILIGMEPALSEVDDNENPTLALKAPCQICQK